MMTTTIWPDLPPDITQFIIFMMIGGISMIVTVWENGKIFT